MRSQRDDSPQGSMDSTGTAAQQNATNLRRIAGPNQSQESFSKTDETSLPPRSRGGLNGMPNTPGRFPDRINTPTSQRALTPENNVSAGKDPLNKAPPIPTPLTIPPERRRPPMPMLDDSRHRGQNSNENIVPAPLASPGMRRDDLRPPTRSSERSQPRERDIETTGSNFNLTKANGLTKASPGDAALSEATQSSTSLPTEPSPPPTNSSTPIEMSQDPKGDEEVRPGLGPMIKKKSKGDIANTFLRVAKTANAFKPRAGGAAERLRDAQAKSSDGPDGITGVVPAPSLVRGQSNDSSNLMTPPMSSEKTSPQKVNDGIPEVKITVPPPQRPSSVGAPLKAAPESSLPEKSKIREVRRPKPASEIMQKELASLGIDPSILNGRGNDLVNAWEEFGWVGEGVHTKNIDQMKEEVDRELNKIQAGGWLSRLEEEDERVEAIKKGLDKCMDECDELDGLLTLYLVELGVSGPILNVSLDTDSFRLSTKTSRTLRRSHKASRSRPRIRNFCKPSSNHFSILFLSPLPNFKAFAKHLWSPHAVLNRSRSPWLYYSKPC